MINWAIAESLKMEEEQKAWNEENQRWTATETSQKKDKLISQSLVKPEADSN